MFLLFYITFILIIDITLKIYFEAMTVVKIFDFKQVLELMFSVTSNFTDIRVFAGRLHAACSSSLRSLGVGSSDLREFGSW